MGRRGTIVVSNEKEKFVHSLGVLKIDLKKS